MELKNEIADAEVGAKMTIVYERDGDKHSVEVTLEEMPQEAR